VNEEKKASTPVGSMVPSETAGHKEPVLHYTSNSYQKILDYHISEILLTTIIFGVILLLRLRH
jgi:hypothetical protein